MTTTNAETTEPKTTDVAARDEISMLGFRTEHLTSGLKAYEMLGDEVIEGEDYADLLSKVRKHAQKHGLRGATLEDEFEPVSAEDLPEIEAVIAEDEENIIDADEIDPDEEEEPPLADEIAGEEELTEDSKGRAYLPGTAPRVNQELTTSALKYHSLKMQRVDLLKQEMTARDELAVMVKKHENLFTSDPDNSDSKIYIAGDIIVRDQIKTDEKITTEEVSSE